MATNETYIDSIISSTFSGIQVDTTDTDSEEDDLVSPPTISVNLFTPLLGLLLLDSNQEVAMLARVSLVRFFCRLHNKPVPTWDEEPSDFPTSTFSSPESSEQNRKSEDDRERLHRHARYKIVDEARDLIEDRMLEDVILGLARLEGGESGWQEAATETSLDGDGRLSPGSLDGKRTEADFEADEYDGWSLGLGFEDRSPSFMSDNFGAPLQPYLDSDRTAVAIESESLRPEYDSEIVQGRLVSLELIAGLASEGCVDDKNRLRLVGEVRRLGRDYNPIVRVSALEALGALALSGVKGDQDLWNMVEALEKDPVPNVRRAAVLVLPPLLEGAVVDVKHKMVQEVLARFRVDENKDVQMALLEATGQMVHLFVDDPDLLPEELLDFFLSQDDGLLPDSEMVSSSWQRSLSGGEKAVVCAFNLPAVALVLGEKRWKRLSPFYTRLAQDLQPKVRKSLASSTHELAKIIGSVQAGTDLVPSFSKLLADPGEEVKASAVDRFDAVVEQLGHDDAKRLMDALKGVWDEGNASWRVREAAAKLLAKTASRLGREVEWEEVLEKAIKDEAAIVRQMAVDAVRLISFKEEAYCR
jgi:HEAT repeat protein